MVLIFLRHPHPYKNMNCHPDQSEAKWSDLLFSSPTTDFKEAPDLPFVIPQAKGRVVLPYAFRAG
jgi:hypothetical protein